MQLEPVHRLARGSAFLILSLLLAGCDAGGEKASTPASTTVTIPAAVQPGTPPDATTGLTGGMTPVAPTIVRPLVSTPISPEESPFTGYLAPNFTLVDLEGHNVTLRNLRGHPVWINLWATWCEPCKSEMPAMQKLYNRYKAQGLVILGVNAQEERSPIVAYVKQGAYDWGFLLDPDSVVRSKYLFGGVPSHVFIDKAGIIQAISIGELDAKGMTAYLARIVDVRPGG